MPTYTGEVTHIELANLPLWLIALLPFLGSITNAIFGRKFQASSWNEGLKKQFHIGSPAVSGVAIAAMLGAFIVAVISFVQLVGLPAEHRYIYTHGWQMLRIGSLDVNFSMAMDPLSGLMTLIITGVGTLIHIYAASYMETEEGLLALLHLLEPLRLRDVAARPGRQHDRDVLRLGGRRPLQLPADRLLVQGLQQGELGA